MVTGRMISTCLVVLISILYETRAFLPSHRNVNCPPPSHRVLQNQNENEERTINRHQHRLPVLLRTNHKNIVTSLRLAKKSGTKKKKANDGTITVNRAARRNYEVVSTYQAGISLLGSEVKAIREGKMTLGDGFVRPSPNGRSCTLYNVHIGKNPSSGEYFQHEERRPRPLLLNKEESKKLAKAVEQQGVTIVPLKAYFSSKNMVKISIGLCKGKNQRDKRNTIRDRESKKDTERMIKNFRAN